MLAITKRKRAVRWSGFLSLLLLTSCSSCYDDSALALADSKLPGSSTHPLQTSARQIPATDRGLIKAGHSVASLQLGDTSERALELLAKPTDDDLYEAPCAPRRMHWYDFANERNGIFVYLKQGRIFQIQSETPRYSTAEGITSDSPPSDVRRHYPRSRAYQLKGSGSKVNGGRDLIYWVDSQKGIAFELRYSYKTRKRLVSYIFVYEPGSNFQPEGCVSAPQEWRELKPFTLEVAGYRVRNQRRR